jgi:putative sigma-54 modulation protein
LIKGEAKLNITVNARHMEITDAIRAYAQDKASKLDRYLGRIISAEIIIGLDGGSPMVEVVVTAPHNNKFVATHRGPDMYGCIDTAVHKVEEQLRRHKDKVRDHKGPGHEAKAELAEGPESEPEPGNP